MKVKLLVNSSRKVISHKMCLVDQFEMINMSNTRARAFGISLLFRNALGHSEITNYDVVDLGFFILKPRTLHWEELLEWISTFLRWINHGQMFGETNSGKQNRVCLCFFYVACTKLVFHALGVDISICGIKWPRIVQRFSGFFVTPDVLLLIRFTAWNSM